MWLLERCQILCGGCSFCSQLSLPGAALSEPPRDVTRVAVHGDRPCTAQEVKLTLFQMLEGYPSGGSLDDIRTCIKVVVLALRSMTPGTRTCLLAIR